jgi:PHP family Zn ribbon phosphoesterase
MRFYADLHIHSPYSIACSRDINPETLCRWGQLKGLTVIGSGDFTHPQWLNELREKLEDAGGLFALKRELQPVDVPPSCRAPVRFLLSAEISCIYKKGGKTRKVHALVFVPDFASALHLTGKLAKIGSITSDGRPILKLDAKHLLEMVLEVSPEAMLVPAHVWTPHFSVLGSFSAFSSLEECFDELTTHIYAVETGLSSDPAMNWRLSTLDRVRLISNSDAHSPANWGGRQPSLIRN